MLFWNVFDGILLTALAACIVVWPTQWISDKQNRILRIVAVGLAAVQCLVDGPRVQLLPAYLIAALFGLLLIPRNGSAEPSAVRESKEGFTKKLLRWSTVIGTGLVLLLSVIYCLVFPRFEYPKPTGKFEVGVHTLRLTDESRAESYTAESNDKRELLLRVTYPAESTTGFRRDTIVNIAAGAPNYTLRASSPNSIFAWFFPLSWGRVQSNAWIDAPISTTTTAHPVILFSHGLGSFQEQYIVITEELASHGFIVLSINHPGLSGGFPQANGGIIGTTQFMKELKAIPTSPDQRSKMEALQRQLADSGAPTAAMIKALKEQEAIDPGLSSLSEAVHRLTSDDQRFVIGELARLQGEDSVLKGHIDLERVGVAGMSLGGTASQITCTSDPRCLAGLNMDGFQSFVADLPPLKVPFMEMSSERNLLAIIPHERSQAPNYLVRIKGTTHASFGDFGLVAPLIPTSKDNGRARSLINDYAVAFFSKHLLQQTEPLLDGPSDRYPEVTFLKK